MKLSLEIRNVINGKLKEWMSKVNIWKSYYVSLQEMYDIDKQGIAINRLLKPMVKSTNLNKVMSTTVND